MSCAVREDRRNFFVYENIFEKMQKTNSLPRVQRYDQKKASNPVDDDRVVVHRALLGRLRARLVGPAGPAGAAAGRAAAHGAAAGPLHPSPTPWAVNVNGVCAELLNSEMLSEK